MSRLAKGKRLKILIDNCRRKKATESETYLDAIAERENRNALKFKVSYPIIMQAAKDRRFVSYKELADASGALFMNPGEGWAVATDPAATSMSDGGSWSFDHAPPG